MRSPILSIAFVAVCMGWQYVQPGAGYNSSGPLPTVSATFWNGTANETMPVLQTVQVTAPCSVGSSPAICATVLAADVATQVWPDRFHPTGLGQTTPTLPTGQPAATSSPTVSTFDLDFNYRPNALATDPLPTPAITPYAGNPRLYRGRSNRFRVQPALFLDPPVAR